MFDFMLPVAIVGSELEYLFLWLIAPKIITRTNTTHGGYFSTNFQLVNCLINEEGFAAGHATF